MKHFAITCILLAHVSTASATQLPTVYEHSYLRTQIEAMPQAERQPLRDWLDAARPVADREVEALASGRTDDACAEIAATSALLGQGFDARELRREIARHCGEIRGYEYRGQQLTEVRSSRDAPGHDLMHATSTVYYLLRTTRHADTAVYAAVDTVMVGGQHRVLYVWFRSVIPGGGVDRGQ